MRKDNIKASIIEVVGGHGGMDYYDIGLMSGLREYGVDATLFTNASNNQNVERLIPGQAQYVYKNIFGKDPAIIRAGKIRAGYDGGFAHYQKQWCENMPLPFFFNGRPGISQRCVSQNRRDENCNNRT